jgi:predicted transcriptional regulator
MIAFELINQLIPPLSPEDRALRAIDWMDEYRVNQLPVVSDNKLLGLIDEDVVFSSTDPDEPIKNLQLKHQSVFIDSQRHLFEVIKLGIEHSIDVIPVIDEESNYLGVVTVNDTARAFSQLASAEYPGGILVLSMNENDYSLSEISRLAEAEGIKILSAFVHTDLKDVQKLKVTLKFNKRDIAGLISTYERFNYKVISQFQEVSSVSYEKERLNILFKYLEL